MQDNIKNHFLESFGMTRPGIEPWSPGPLANSLGQWMTISLTKQFSVTLSVPELSMC